MMFLLHPRKREREIKVKKTVVFSSFLLPLCPRENGREKKRERKMRTPKRPLERR
jgi:hypothetical protein|tara:strand:+ start:3710 stop:3874 length:165 start_codon:yes stop_codon:yes gene_type:complete